MKIYHLPIQFHAHASHIEWSYLWVSQKRWNNQFSSFFLGTYKKTTHHPSANTNHSPPHEKLILIHFPRYLQGNCPSGNTNHSPQHKNISVVMHEKGTVFHNPVIDGSYFKRAIYSIYFLCMLSYWTIWHLFLTFQWGFQTMRSHAPCPSLCAEICMHLSAFP